MFLFLSKLLPLFVYPMGLSCVLMVVSLVLLWKWPKRAAISLSLALLVLLLGGNSWVNRELIQSLELRHIPPEELPTAEAIVVLGGGIKAQIYPRPWVDVSEAGDRILHGSQLYLQGKAPRLILTGGRINWKDGGPPESADMAQIARALGVPEEAILEDPSSLNTHENAVNVRQILDEEGINRVLLVTSATHMPRSLLVFQKQGIEAIPAPTDYLSPPGRNPSETETSWESALLSLIPDASRLRDTTNAIKEYIGLFVYGLRGWI